MHPAADHPPTSWRRRALLAVLLVAALGMGAPGVHADETAEAVEEVEICAYDEVRVDEKLGQVIPKGIELRDSDGETVELRSLIDRPTVLLLVYLRCPRVCSPLMTEIAHTVDELDILAGVDFNLVTVSFDARETPDLARRGKANLLARMEKKVPPESWRFLTGDAKNIRKLCDSVGFYFMQDGEGDYKHPSPVIFLSKDGKIVRYLPHTQQRTKEDRNKTVPGILPAQFELAVNDARDGKARSFMQSVQQICYSYDPEGRAYVLNVNRIILFVTLGGLGIFLAVLLLKRKKKPASASTAGAVSDEATGGGHA